MQFTTKLPKKLALVLSTVLLVAVSFFLSVAPAAAETYEVKMGADNGMLAFVPNDLTISAGDTLKFVNNKLAPHNVVFEGHPELSNKQLLFSPGQSVETTIADPGKYSFYCEPHRGAGMVGTVTVK
ncbi:MAG: plastocyanin [Oscillatoria sp. PMC 1068.18]|nr:plastocyanin [Oscillatoria sp. PMC 1076.18]MEC4991144.1 plastocyanin [Oscillatoria sp. PMC 1068.18]